MRHGVRLLVLLSLTYQVAGQTDPDGTFRILHAFAHRPATDPVFGIALGPNDTAFGVTFSGGNPACSSFSGCGTVYALSRTADKKWAYKIIYLFNGGNDGALPDGRPLVDADGNLYGTTWMGGSQGYGTIYRLTHSAEGRWVKSILYNFKGYPDGDTPYGGLIADPAGNLYGTTLGGGMYLAGIAFKLTRNSNGRWTESILHSFGSSVGDGYCPAGPLAFDKDWNLYGTTTCGGTFGWGTVFELAQNSSGQWDESVLYSFRGSLAGDGELPFAGPTLDEAGNIFGTTGRGGPDDGGTVFELSRKPSGDWVETIVHTFLRGGDGFTPGGPVTLDASGVVYGSTEQGGTAGRYGFGTLFALSFQPDEGWTETILHSFTNGYDGAYASGGVTVDPEGNVFGTTQSGGATANGVIYEFARF